MIDPVLFLAFVPVALALNLTPGADMMFCLAQGMKGGARPAIAASAGISAGVMIHVGLAGLGLGALVAAFPEVFGAIRWAGAGYLAWLAWKTLRTPMMVAEAPPARTARAFRDGLIVNLANPKVILFVLALLLIGSYFVLRAFWALARKVFRGIIGLARRNSTDEAALPTAA